MRTGKPQSLLKFQSRELLKVNGFALVNRERKQRGRGGVIRRKEVIVHFLNLFCKEKTL